MSTMNILQLHTVPLAKLKLQQENENADEIINKKTKYSSESSMTTSSQVLGQISMNQQTKKDKKRRVSDGSTGKIKSSPGVSVARRNARERNRVKQVNNGFSMLRDHIPPEIADTFEQAGRGSAKKLSKVETLRMAVEYIRSLEQMLSYETSNDSESSSPMYLNNNTSSFSETSLPATPPPETQQPFFYALKPHGNLMETQITIINGQQYIRIPGTNAFQLVTHDSFENEENVHPVEFQVIPPMIQPMTNVAPSLINSTTTPAGSISPYSGHSSISPAPSHAADNIKKSGVIMGEGPFLKTDNEFQHALMMNDASHYDSLVLKQEIMEDEMFDDSSLSNEHMMDAMQWWEHEQQQNLSHSTTPWKFIKKLSFCTEEKN